MENICSYGCGKEGKYTLKNKKFCCSDSSNKCSSVIEKRRNDIKEFWKNISEDKLKKLKEKQSKITKEKWIEENSIFRSNESLEKRKINMLKRWKDPNSKFNSIETKEKQRLINLKNREIGIYNTEEFKNKLSKKHKEIWNDLNSNYNKKDRSDKISVKIKNLYLDENFLIKRQKGLKVKPNRLEKVLLNILNELNLNKFKFVGDSTLWIKGKNPDFICRDERLLIEIFGDYWHSEKQTGINEIDHENQRKEHFKNNGYKTLIIWENEFKNLDKIKQKIRKFISGEGYE